MKPFAFGMLLGSPIWVGVAFIPPLGWWTAAQLLVPPLGALGIFAIAKIAVDRGWVK